MMILVERVVESLEYLITSIESDLKAGKDWSPDLGFSELFCQLFDDTGLSDSIEGSTLQSEVGLLAGEALQELSDHIDSIDLSHGALSQDQALVFHGKLEKALISLRVGRANTTQEDTPPD